MSFTNEFAIVDVVTARLELETAGIDAFALSVIKAERQIRRLFTHVVFQCPAFGYADIPALRDALWKSKRCYFEGFERGIDVLYPRTVASLVGPEYRQLRDTLDDAIDVRNKVFHGQITNRCLDRPALLQYVTNIRRWCEVLSISALKDVGYDGFQRDSFRKGRPRIAETYRYQLADLQLYKKLLKEYVERPPGNQQWQAPAVP